MCHDHKAQFNKSHIFGNCNSIFMKLLKYVHYTIKIVTEAERSCANRWLWKFWSIFVNLLSTVLWSEYALAFGQSAALIITRYTQTNLSPVWDHKCIIIYVARSGTQTVRATRSKWWHKSNSLFKISCATESWLFKVKYSVDLTWEYPYQLIIMYLLYF